MADELVLLDLPVSPFTARVKIALAEKGIGYETREEDLWNKSSLLLKMNPVNKTIPVLIHQGRPISESMIIVQYIDEVWNHKPSLLPSDPYQRAHARFWSDYIDQKIFPNERVLWRCKNKEVREASKKELIECFKVLEGELGEKEYFEGERFGYVDLCLISYYPLFYTIEKFGNLSMVEVCPKLVAWAERCMKKETVSKSLCDKYQVYQFILDAKQKLGDE